jgi:hypothetical protein
MLGHGLAIEDGALGIGEVTDPTDAGPIVELTAKGWATQDGTPSPSYPQEIRRVTGHTISGKTGRFVDILVTHDGTTTTIPIPLPSRGWVAALPDGTADTLALDGAGGYEWTLATSEVTYDGSETWVFSNGYSDTSNGRYCYYESNGLLNHLKTDNANRLSNRFRAVTNAALRENKEIGTFSLSAPNLKGNVTLMTEYATLADFNTWLQSNPVTVLYPLNAPTTESGYVDSMPTVPIHASISSTDLHDLAVRCCADEGAAEIASAWGRRYESRIANLESAVAELVAGA